MRVTKRLLPSSRNEWSPVKLASTSRRVVAWGALAASLMLTRGSTALAATAETPKTTAEPAQQPLPTNGPDESKGSLVRGLEWKEDGVTGRVAWGKNRALRLLFPGPPTSLKAGDYVCATVVNEGDRTVVVDPRDTWVGIAPDGKETELKPFVSEWTPQLPDYGLEIASASYAEVCLSVARDLPNGLRALRYRSWWEEFKVDVQAPYRRARPKMVVAPLTPAGGSAADEDLVASVTAIVGTDGKVERVLPRRARGRSVSKEQMESVRSAVARWVFEPATENGVPQRWVYQSDFSLGRRSRSLRAVFRVPPATMATRIERSLKASSDAVLTLPSVNGFVLRDAPRLIGGFKEYIVHLLRWGEDTSEVGSTWVAITSFALSMPTEGRWCRCDWIEPLEPAARAILDQLSSSLEVPPSEVRALGTGGLAEVPSGALEPPEISSWSLSAISDWVRGTPDQSPSENAGHALISENDILNSGEAPPLSQDMSPPTRIRKMAPRCPELARRKHIAGRVLLKAVIATDGHVKDIWAVEGPSILVRAAMEAVCCWEYEPATAGGKPVSIIFNITVDFTLK